MVWRAIIFYSFVVFFARAALAEVLCIAGDSRETRIIDQISGKKPVGNDEFLRSWRERMALREVSEDRECLAGRGTIREFTGALTRSEQTQKYIKRECVEKLVAGLSIAEDERQICDSDTGGQKTLERMPCLDQSYVDYVHWAANQAIRCLGSSSGGIDARIVLGKIASESRFATFVRSGRGVGLGQLTSVGLEEVSEGGRGFAYMVNLMKNDDGSFKDECKVFEPIIAAEPKGPVKGAKRICQLVGLGGGVARSFLKSIGLFVYYRDNPKASITQGLIDAGLGEHPDFIRMRDYLALIAYGPDGAAGAMQIVRELKARKKLLGHSSRFTFASFKRLVDDSFDYAHGVELALRSSFGPSDKSDPNFDRPGSSCVQDADKGVN